MNKKRIKAIDLKESDVLIVGSKEYSGFTINYAPGRVNVVGPDIFQSIPTSSKIWVKTR